MGTNKLINISGKHQVTNLRANIQTFSFLSIHRVPESDGSVSSSTSWNQQTMLMRRPSKSLHSRSVSHQTESRRIWMQRPNVESVVISSWSQLLLVERPFQTTNLLFMSNHFVDSLVCTKVADQNVFVSRTAGYDVKVVPGQRTYSCCVALVSVQKSLLDAIPKLDFTRMSSHCQGVSSRIEIRACDHILVTHIHQSYDLWVSSIP